MKAALFCKVTPQRAGSVIPQIAVIPADEARAFLLVSLVFKAIARATPPEPHSKPKYLDLKSKVLRLQ